ncbi:MAG: hypothetical protein EXS31_18545 [Pedosphaera sp.]|nr:hypothetical protein [Pedosphaera sp.]
MSSNTVDRPPLNQMREPSNEAVPTRWSLLERLKNTDDQESWREFFATYRNLIHSVALRSGLTEAEADDVVQDTIIAVAKKMPGFDARPEAGSFKSFLLLITRRRIVDQFRKRPPASASPGRGDETARTATIDRVPDPASLDLDAV